MPEKPAFEQSVSINKPHHDNVVFCGFLYKKTKNENNFKMNAFCA
mgnify:CR=1 FL=1